MKRLNFADIEANVPSQYAEETTASKLETGLNRVAPPGKRANTETCRVYEKKTDLEAGKKLVKNWGNSRLFA
jgi:hypothetical protein